MDDSLIRDIYQRLGGIEAKVDDIRAIRNTANDAQSTAQLALVTAERVDDDLKVMQAEQRANKRWLIGLIVTTLFSVVGVVFAIINAI